MEHLNVASHSRSSALRDDIRDVTLHSKHKVFLSHSGAQKDFVEQLCVDLERFHRYPFFDKRSHSLPIGENFPQLIFDAIAQCWVGVVILSNDFFTRSKWPMIELVAMVKEAKKRESSFKIMPAFFCISLDEFHNPTNREQWRLRWHELALVDKRVNVEEWEGALKYLHPINSMVYDGLGEVKFRKVIVDEICKVVPSDMKLYDSHIQGKLRLCEVIQEKINVQQKGKNHEVCVVGLYGMGGIGKTSISKALCNEFFLKFRGRVCHAELERRSKEELMREVLRKFTDTNRELLNEWNEDELLKGLKSGIIKEAVFLALDNVSDTQASINEAKSYLSASLPHGSIVMVTSRSKYTLKKLRPYVDEDNCLEMPELDVQEAKSLFIISSNFEPKSEDDEKLVMHCVERCHFRKDDGSAEHHHYHPLALDVLGKQLGCIDPKEWEAQLYYQSREADDSIYSILRKSFDALSPEDQLLFMDVALFLPWHQHGPYMYQRAAYNYNMFEWLGMVHRTSVGHVIRGLERLKTKSLLESLGDGINTSMGMHDLWRSFCSNEVKSGEFKLWVHQRPMNSTDSLVETRPPGTCWENVKRVAFFGRMKSRTFEGLNFAHFSNVKVLQISAHNVTKELVLDLSGLIQLRSLELRGEADLHRLVIKGLPRYLVFLIRSSKSRDQFFFGAQSSRKVPKSSQQFLGQVECLTELQHLQLIEFLGAKLPDMRNLISIRVAIFYGCSNARTLTGLSSKLSNLRVLDLGGCSQLRSCAGMGDLVALEELNLWGCAELKNFPNIGKLRNLRKLDVRDCLKIREVPGLGDLVALEEFYAGRNLSDYNDLTFFELPEMHKLRNLRVLCLNRCPLEAVVGLENLITLQDIEADFRYLEDRPSLGQLTKLRTLKIDGLESKGLEELDNLVMLQDLEIRWCYDLDKLPRLRSLTNLKNLELCSCNFTDVSSLSNLSALESLQINFCNKLERLPDLQTLTRLENLDILKCKMLRGLDCELGQVGGSATSLEDTSNGSDLPETGRFKGLRTLHLSSCKNFEFEMDNGALPQLQHLFCMSLKVSELPDLSNFPQLKTIRLIRCSLRRLTSREPLNALLELDVMSCNSLTSLPDLSHFPRLQTLHLTSCEMITTLSSSGPLTKLEWLSLEGCIRLKALPDVGMFPAPNHHLSLKGCSQLTTLSSSATLPGFSGFLDVSGCSSLRRDDLDQLQAKYPQCKITDDSPDVVNDAGIANEAGSKTIIWSWRAVGAGAMILALGWMLRTCRRSRARKL
ncbi:hypothetical protein M758_7G154700 [Ceratodon purpureus]|nr:hypothetical protein M758_7G154700 [Ceratodon purpureus]